MVRNELPIATHIAVHHEGRLKPRSPDPGNREDHDGFPVHVEPAARGSRWELYYERISIKINAMTETPSTRAAAISMLVAIVPLASG